MGKVDHHEQFITHSSHPHKLELCNLNLSNNSQTSTPNLCTACCLPLSTGYIYTCKSCPNFSLHLSCSQIPSSITHPSHPQHSLSLSPVSPYRSGQIICDACNLNSPGFNYHCSTCSFDLHIKCANKPLTLNHNLHPHTLHLTFAPPYEDGNRFSCDVCGHLGGTSEWLYRCASCGFDVHLDCPSAPAGVAGGVSSGHRSPAPAPAQQGGQMYNRPSAAQQSMGMGTYNRPPPADSRGMGNYNRPPAAQSMGDMALRHGVQQVVGWGVQHGLDQAFGHHHFGHHHVGHHHQDDYNDRGDDRDDYNDWGDDD